MDQALSNLLSGFVEKIDLLRQEMQQQHELDKYEARIVRIEQKLSALADHIAHDDDPAHKSNLMIAFVEKVGLLRRDMQLRKELDKYEEGIAPIGQALSVLADHVAHDDPDLAGKLRSAWQLPARSLAFRNADHQKDMKKD